MDEWTFVGGVLREWHDDTARLMDDSTRTCTEYDAHGGHDRHLTEDKGRMIHMDWADYHETLKEHAERIGETYRSAPSVSAVIAEAIEAYARTAVDFDLDLRASKLAFDGGVEAKEMARFVRDCLRAADIIADTKDVAKAAKRIGAAVIDPAKLLKDY